MFSFLWMLLTLSSVEASTDGQFLASNPSSAAARNLGTTCHDCGVCRCVSKQTCNWCDGMGGAAEIVNTYTVGGGSSSGGSSPGGGYTGPELVNCGVCKNVPRSSCNYCDGQGGPASVDSVDVTAAPTAEETETEGTETEGTDTEGKETEETETEETETEETETEETETEETETEETETEETENEEMETEETAPVGKSKPHILFLLADDLGWANIGYHRTSETADEKQGALEVQTPTINNLVDEGIALERHYSYRICGPARSALLSGRLAPRVLVKNVAVTASNPEDPVSGFAGIPRNMTGMGEKMKAGGYRTHYVGKWDAGMATPQHTPYGRGFETSLMYYQHANDMWDKKTGIQATGEITTCLNAFHDLMIENETYRGPYKGAALTDSCKESEERAPDCYEEKIFEDRSLEIIKNHDAKDKEHPLFLFHAFHLLHTPLQVPKYYFQKIEKDVIKQGGKKFDSENRRYLMAMTRYMDDTIKNLTEAFKAKGMWENTLVVFTTDNGGPIYEPGSSNNYPLRGGKYSDFEGGVRTSTFISGGYIPEARRGKVYNGVVSVADWYTIFSELAGVEPRDEKAEAANKWLTKKRLSLLAGVEGKKGILEAILANKEGPRDKEPLFLSANALLEYPYKLVTGKQPYMAHTGPLYPNCSTVESMTSGNGPDFIDFSVLEKKIDLGDSFYWRGDCGSGCLFNVEEDPTESKDLSKDAEQQPRLQRMINTLAEFNRTLFMPERGETSVQACYSAMLNGGGHFGPFVDIEGYYTEKPRVMDDLNEHERMQMALMGVLTFEGVKKATQKEAPSIVLGMLEKFSDKCCHTQKCDGNNSMALPDAIAFIKNITTREHKENKTDRLI